MNKTRMCRAADDMHFKHPKSNRRSGHFGRRPHQLHGSLCIHVLVDSDSFGSAKTSVLLVSMACGATLLGLNAQAGYHSTTATTGLIIAFLLA